MLKRYRSPALSALTFAALLLTALLWTAFGDVQAPLPARALPEITVPEGFTVEHLFSPTSADSSSWVALTTDGQGRLIASDQYGALYRITPPPIGQDPSGTRVEKLDLELGYANGLLWAFNSLYVMVNAEDGVGGRDSGLYRVTDSDGDGELDRVRRLFEFEGAGEHGPHNIVLGPDGESLYLIAGNYTEVPEDLSSSLVPTNWKEDNLLPTLLDPRGHAVDRTAPGGWLARTDSAGHDLEMFAIGFRNAYDLGFNADGELFVFDSDMEWDLGMPWYRPIRLTHVTSGSDFGWRTGSTTWPSYFPDSQPPILELGQGSPTGVAMGRNAKFPQRYQHGTFIFDWSFGTIYYVALQPDGASYTAEGEEFLTGVPLPLTDGVFGPDGALYFATGGRDLESHLYRVYYSGTESTAPAPRQAATPPERTLRRHLEAFHGRRDPGAVDAAWPHLNHPDRYVRYAARVALEHQPVASWADRLWSEPDPLRRLYGAVALARQGTPEQQDRLLEALSGIDFASLSEDRRLDLLRAYSLTFTRMGVPSGAWRARIAAALDAHFPSGQERVDRELARTLAYLDAPGFVEETLAQLERYAERGPAELISEEAISRSKDYGPVIARMRANMPQPQEIAYALYLSGIEDGWTLDQRRRYFRWFYDALTKEGGESYKGFLDAIRAQALRNVPAGEQEALATLTGAYTTSRRLNLADLPQPEGPGKTYNFDEVARLVWEQMEKQPRSFERGKRMYAAALCQTCHTMQGEGGTIGPDLTQVGTRFSTYDLLHTLFSPSAQISDQYGATLITLTDGGTVVGRVVRENDEEVVVNQNPFTPDETITLAASDIQTRAASPISLMPAHLLDRLNEEEIMDLMAFLLSGADPAHEYFQPDNSSSNGTDGR